MNGGSTDGHAGRVEICFQGSWGSVCWTTWDRRETEVVCRQLGFENTGMYIHKLHFELTFINFQHTGTTGVVGLAYGPGRGPVHLEYLSCTGEEETLSECDHSPVGSVSSQLCKTHNFDIAVQCITGMNYQCITYLDGLMLLIFNRMC